MTAQQQFFPLLGGLDQESAVAVIPPGRALSVCNYESVSRGYQRTQGFERFDGRAAPSEMAGVEVVHFTGGVTALDTVVAGTEVRIIGGGNTYRGLAVDVPVITSGTTAGSDAVGYVGLVHISGSTSILAGGALRDSLSTFLAVFDHVVVDEDVPEADDGAWATAGREVLRDAIEEVPGAEQVRGVLWFDGRLTAWRDGTVSAINFDTGSSEITVGMTITGGTSGATATVLSVTLNDNSGEWGDGSAAGVIVVESVIGTFQNNENLDGGADGLAVADGTVYALSVGKAFHATDAGWVEIDLGATLKFDTGTIEFELGTSLTGNTSGAHGIIRSFTLTPDAGEWGDGSAAGVVVLEAVTGAFEDNEELHGGGAVLHALANGAMTVNSFPAGGRYEFETHNFYGSVGTDLAYGVNGTGPAFAYDGNETIILIPTGMPDDTPFLVEAHKRHLFLGFRGGSLQHSATGDPLSFDAVFGAAELGFGHELTNIVPNAGGTLMIGTEQGVSILYGNDVSDWEIQTLSEDESGAKAWTARRIGKTIYLDERGVRALDTTASFGGFKLGSYTTLIQKTLADKRAAHVFPTASAVVKAKDQYLLFFDDGSGISIYFGRKQPEAMLFDYPFVVSCIDVAEVDGQERIFVGATNGFVYELNKGTSFDGDEIDAYIQLAFAHQGGPRVLKRYHKAILDLIAQPGMVLNVSAQFDLGTGAIQPLGIEEVFSIDGGGGTWGSAGETVEVSPTLAQAEAYLRGMGANMSLVVYSSSAVQESDILQGVTLAFSPRGQMR